MFVFYDDKTLTVRHVVYSYPENYRDFAVGHPDSFIQRDQPMNVDDIVLQRNQSSQAVEIVHRLRMSLTQQGQHITGIPQDTVMTINNSPLGVMDASGEVELTFPTPGTYKLALTHPHYFSEELTFETHL